MYSSGERPIENVGENEIISHLLSATAWDLLLVRGSALATHLHPTAGSVGLLCLTKLLPKPDCSKTKTSFPSTPFFALLLLWKCNPMLVKQLLLQQPHESLLLGLLWFFKGQLAAVASCFPHILKDTDWFLNTKSDWKRGRLALYKMDVQNSRLELSGIPVLCKVSWSYLKFKFLVTKRTVQLFSLLHTHKRAWLAVLSVKRYWMLAHISFIVLFLACCRTTLENTLKVDYSDIWNKSNLWPFAYFLHNIRSFLQLVEAPVSQHVFFFPKRLF